jgi:arginase family enzyme
MDLNYYLNPVSLEKPANYSTGKEHFRDNIIIHTQNNSLKNYNFDIAIIGVNEERNSLNIGCAKSPDIIRTYLYQLSKISGKLKVADLGNIKNGNTINDSYFALRDIIIELLSRNIVPIIVGGSHDLTYSLYLAYKHLNKSFNLLTIDSKIDIGTTKSEINSYSYLSKILLNKKKTVKKYINIGHQNYLTDEKDINLLEKLNYESIRLGQIRSKITETEPLIRDSNVISIDVSAIKQADAPGHAFPSPNGLTSDEICQISKYAGLSDNINAFGIFEVNPDFDYYNQTSNLAAQIIWIFIESMNNRFNENPSIDETNFQKFIVDLSNYEKKIIFYKSLKSSRWWIEIPTENNSTEIISCNYEDYMKAYNGEIPEIYLKYL